MVVGATGAIGSACSRLLAQAGRRGLSRLQSEMSKLLTLKETILKNTPTRWLHLAATTHDLVEEMDMVVTATSGAGKKVLDIMKVKLGCVITDVARPLDLPPKRWPSVPTCWSSSRARSCCPARSKWATSVCRRTSPMRASPRRSCSHSRIASRLHDRRNIEWQKVQGDLPARPQARHAPGPPSRASTAYFSDDDIARVRELALAARARQAGSRQAT